MKILDTIRLSTNQKRVVAKIIAAPTPKIAAEEISDGSNMIAARDMLMKLGIITLQMNDAAELTDKGRQLAQAENLADETGNLTPDGEKYAYTDETGGEDKDVTPPPEATPAPGTDTGMGTTPLTMSYTSGGSLLRELFHNMDLDIRR